MKEHLMSSYYDYVEFSKMPDNARKRNKMAPKYLKFNKIILEKGVVEIVVGEQSRVDGSKVMFIVLSQPNSYHVERAKKFKQHFNSQIEKLNEKPELYLLHEKWPDHGSWSIFPLLKTLPKEFGEKHWVLFCEEETRIDVLRLLSSLNRYNHQEELFLGRGLTDRTGVVIHHYRRIDPKHNFTYPDFAAGVPITMTLIKRIVQRLNDEKPSMNFVIDVKHELAWFIFDDGKGPVMKNVTFLCTNNVRPECVTRYTETFPQCGEAVPDDEVFFAVKTCGKYHNDRIPIVKRTWFSYAENIEFYSEKADASIPTLDLGVPNTERGHCGKLQAILERAYKEEHIKNKKWLVIADDDTLLCIPRLKLLLACYNSSEPVALGERYGYSLIQGWGYNYITGGGSMVLSMKAVRKIVECERCACSKIEDPDDMLLGMWLKRLDIPITHSPLFHQARAADYAPEYLAHQSAVSFHKFWNNDPITDYKMYLMHLTEHDEL